MWNYYLETENNNVVAINTETPGEYPNEQQGFVAGGDTLVQVIEPTADFGFTWSWFTNDFLNNKCSAITEEEARQRVPVLFAKRIDVWQGLYGEYEN